MRAAILMSALIMAEMISNNGISDFYNLFTVCVIDVVFLVFFVMDVTEYLKNIKKD